MDRPTCPKHPGSTVWRDGFYGKPPRQRQRWRCNPKKRSGQPVHQFTELLPRQRTNLSVCDECERPFAPHEGQPGALQYAFTIRQVARALVRVGEGTSYREAAHRTRHEGNPNVYDKRQPNVVMDWVELFAPVVTKPHLVTDVPACLVVDSLEFRAKGGAGKQGGATLFSVLGIVGYAKPGEKRVVRLVARPDATKKTWQDLFATFQGAPSRVICDESRALLPAIRDTWPEPATYVCLCTYHLLQHMDDHLKVDGLYGALQSAAIPGLGMGTNPFADLATWNAFEAAVRTVGARDTIKWLDTKPTNNWPRSRAEHIRLQLGLPNPAGGQWPRSNGGVENVLDTVGKNYHRRRYAFHNQERMDRLFLLLQSKLNRTDNERNYAALIRKWCADHHGQGGPRRLIDDTGAWQSPGSLR